MTKAEIVQFVCDHVGGFSQHEAATLVDSVFEMIKKRLVDGEKVKISRFGKFVVRYKKPRKGRNPKTGVPITLSERHVVRFHPSPILRTMVNEIERPVQEIHARVVDGLS